MNQRALESKVGRSLAPQTIVVLGLVLSAAYVLGLMFTAGNYDSLVALIVGPLLFCVTLPVLARQATREGDGRVFWFLVIGLGLKLLGAIAQVYVSFTAYGGVADAAGYYKDGLALAAHFRAGDFVTGLHPIVGTNFIKIATGVVLAIIGPSRTAAFLVFSWLGFWGIFLFYRAFLIGVPQGRSRTYARLLFLLPSLIFWPSAIGKDAWMVMGLGITAFGSAKMLRGHLWRGLAIAGLGFGMQLMVRPHVAALAGVAMAGGFLLRRSRTDLRQLAPVVKVLSAVVVLGVALLLIRKGDSFLKESGFAHPTNLTSSLDKSASITYIGNSVFQPSSLTTWRHAPLAFVTVLFRPILVDARSFQSAIAAAEGTFLLALTLIRIRWIIAALKSMRRQPYIGVALVFTGLFVVAFSSIANFGLLVRQRSSVLPFFLVLLSVPPKRMLLSREVEVAATEDDVPTA